MTIDLENQRNEYRKTSLLEKKIPGNPFRLLSEWLNYALDNHVPESGAMVLSTVGNNGNPSSRVVLLKSFEDEKLFFYTNYDSRKAQEIINNHAVSALFFWPELERQIRIEGKAYKSSSEKSDEYFSKRPRDSQIGAWASPQSSVISDMNEIKTKIFALKARYKNKDIPRPQNWGGFYISPERIEFWQGKPARLNDRIAYYLENKNWKRVRLAP